MSNFNIISIHSVPRSGSSWLGQIFDSSERTISKFQPLSSNTFKSRIGSESTKEEIYKFYEDIYNTKDDFIDAEYQKRQGIYQRFENKIDKPDYLATKNVRYHYIIPNIINHVDGIKVICIVRNPCASIYSWSTATEKEFLPEWDIKNHWYFAQGKNLFKPEEYYGFHKWKEFAKLALVYQENYPENVRMIRYEDLLANPIKHIKSLFEFCNLEFSESVEDFIKKTTEVETNADYYSVFKANKNPHNWKGNLNEGIVKQISSELAGTELEQFLK